MHLDEKLLVTDTQKYIDTYKLMYKYSVYMYDYGWLLNVIIGKIYTIYMCNN